MSIFSKIISGEIPCHKVAETEEFLAFLDIMPLVRGHVLVIPKKPVDYIFDLDETTYTGLHLFAQKVARALKMAFPCKKIGTAVIGLEVPHVHIHLIPMHQISDMNFGKEKLQLSATELAADAEKIKSYLE